MRILWVKMGGLWPSTTGGRVRSLQTISALAQRHEVSVITTHGAKDDPEGLSRKLSHCSKVVSVWYEPPKFGSAAFPATVVRSWFSRLPVDLWKWQVPEVASQVQGMVKAGAVDLIIADFLFAAANVPLGASSSGRSGEPDNAVPVVLFEHNVEYIIWQRLAQLEKNPVKRALFELEWRKLRACEAEACRLSNLTIAVSDDDRERLLEIAPGINATSIPTGVDTTFFTPRWGEEKPGRLVFSGSMDWHPNEDAVVYFADAILPRIRAEIPEATLTIVGRNPSTRVREVAERTGMIVTGTVADVRPSIAEGAVYVVPLRAGGGTRLKIFEALAMGKAVVSTTVGAEGLGLEPGEHFVAADDPESFARETVALMRNDVRRRALERAGRRLVEENYSWATVARQFEERCLEVVTEHEEEPGLAVGGAYLPRGGSPRSRGARIMAGEHHDVSWSHHHS